MRPVVVAFGGWWSQNFGSRNSQASGLVGKGLKLSKLSGSSSRRKNKLGAGDSTCQLATTDAETTYIYGQGSNSDTVVEGKRRSVDDKELESGDGLPGDGGIKVKYEVMLDFTETDDTPHTRSGVRYDNNSKMI